jgi:hypothetical protein
MHALVRGHNSDFACYFQFYLFPFYHLQLMTQRIGEENILSRKMK